MWVRLLCKLGDPPSQNDGGVKQHTAGESDGIPKSYLNGCSIPTLHLIVIVILICCMCRSLFFMEVIRI